MASIIKVDQIQTAAGGTPTAADLGLNTTGSVLQVVQVVAGTGDQVNVSSSSATEVMSASITPSSASSKILVQCSFSGYIGGETTTETYKFELWRGAVSSGTQLDNRIFSRSSGYVKSFPGQFNYLDSPSTTSSTDYKISIKRTGGSDSIAWLIDHASGEHATITLIEIAG